MKKLCYNLCDFVRSERFLVLITQPDLKLFLHNPNANKTFVLWFRLSFPASLDILHNDPAQPI